MDCYDYHEYGAPENGSSIEFICIDLRGGQDSGK